MHNIKILMFIPIFLFSIISQNAIADRYYVECTEQNGCIKQIQSTIDAFREQMNLVGVQVTISLPAQKKGYQPFITLTSGYTTKEQLYPVGAKSPMQPREKIDLFADGSITKSFTSSITLQLESEGKLNLNDTIGKYLPQYKAWKNITIQQLLNMTSGIFDYTDNQDFWTVEVAEPAKQWTLQELIEFSYQNKKRTTGCPKGGNLCFTPGTNWMYSNTNYLLAQMIIENVTGQHFSEVINLRLIGKNAQLGQLENTYYFDSSKKLDPHFFPVNIWYRAVHGYYPLQSIIDPAGQYPEDDVTDMNLSYASGAGANISNSEDIIKWTRLLFQTTQVLQLPQQKELNSLICTGRICDANGEHCHKSSLYGQPIPQLSADCNAGFGLGIGRVLNEVDGVERSYDGTTPGYHSFYVLFEKYNIDISAQGDGQNSVAKLVFDILPILKSFHVVSK